MLVSIFTFGLFFRFVSPSVCLTNPPELIWNWNSTANAYYGNISIQPQTFFTGDATIAEFTTRAFDGIIPGPTIVMSPGNTYYITYFNNLHAESADNDDLEENELRHPNSTNLHTHGLHISGEAPGDNVFQIIDPLSSHTYKYEMKNNHAGGTFFYHPHLHGSTAIQTGGGAAGALIVTENSTMEGLPYWLTNMSDIVLVIQYFDLPTLDNLYDSSIDYLFSYDTSTSLTNTFHLVNGYYQPSICVQSNEWTRLRIVYSQLKNPQKITLNGCNLYLLSKDGVLIHGDNNTVPRSVDAMWFTTASRAEVAIYCPGNSTSGNRSYEMKDENDDTIAYITVNGTEIEPMYPNTTLTPFNPIRPNYLIDLRDYDGYFQEFCEEEDTAGGGGGKGRRVRRLADCDTTTLDYATISVSANAIMGITFEGSDAFLFETEINTVLEFQIESRGGEHPFHMHVNHMQLQSGATGGEDVPDNWTVAGDFLDVVHGDSTVRFYTDTYGGHVVMHCHILDHEDEGAMGQFLINGGCEADGMTDYDTTGTYSECGSNVTNTGDDTDSSISLLPFNYYLFSICISFFLF